MILCKMIFTYIWRKLTNTKFFNTSYLQQFIYKIKYTCINDSPHLKIRYKVALFINTIQYIFIHYNENIQNTKNKIMTNHIVKKNKHGKKNQIT